VLLEGNEYFGFEIDISKEIEVAVSPGLSLSTTKGRPTGQECID
jgi:hypothetical protein